MNSRPFTQQKADLKLTSSTKNIPNMMLQTQGSVLNQV